MKKRLNKGDILNQRDDLRAIRDRRALEALARDDLSRAYAGRENRGPAAKPKKNFSSSTNVKRRNTGPKH